MRRATALLATAIELESPLTSRQLAYDDGALLGTLIYNALQGTVDNAGETKEYWQKEASMTLRNRDNFLWHASSIILAGDLPVSTAVISLEGDNAFLLYAMTDPHFQGRGLASAQIHRCLDLLQKSGITTLRLCVTEQNHQALRLYQKLGFTIESEFFHLKVVFKT